jgi:N6-adenosine-specific RNA methylase IME4
VTDWEGLTPPYATIVADPPWPYEDGPVGWQRMGRKRAFLPYSRMTLDEIKALPVADLAAPRAHLYLWTTNRFLWDARDVALAWGFTPSQILVWCKQPKGRGPGALFANTTEFIIVAFSDRRAGVLIQTAREAAGLTRAQVFDHVRGGRRTGLVSNWEMDLCLPNERDWLGLQAVLPTLADTPRPSIPRVEQSEIPTSWFEWKRGKHSEKPPAALDLIEQVSPGPYVELFARRQRLGWDSWGYGYEQSA